MHPIMIDSEKACKNYRDARGERMGGGWHKIELADKDATVWRKKSASVRGDGNKTNCGPRRVGYGLSGYITKNGFQPNT